MTQPDPQDPTSLDAIHVAEPCTQAWDAMTGDDRSRFCGSCRLHVYDLSSMTRAEAEELVMSRKRAGEHLCVRFFRRADGTVVTDDCGPIRRAIRRRALRVRAAVVAAFAMILPVTACRQTTVMGKPGMSPQEPPPGLEDYEETQTLGNLCDPEPPAPPPAPAAQPAPPKAETCPAAPPAAAPAAAPAAPAPAPPAPPPTEWTGKI